MPEFFRKKPVVIQAVRWTGNNTDEIVSFMGVAVVEGHDLIITTLEGEMAAHPGWWIIRGVQGEFYPCDPDIFAMTYEKVTVE